MSGIASAKMQRIVLDQTQRPGEDFKPVESLAHLPLGPWGPGLGAGEPESESGPHSGSYSDDRRPLLWGRRVPGPEGSDLQVCS